MKKIGTVRKVTLVERINDDVDYCKVQIDFTEYGAYIKFAELEEFLNSKVEYTTRTTMHNGELVQVIVNFLYHEVIRSVECDISTVKLIPEVTQRGYCDFDVANFKVGDFEKGSVVLLTNYEFGSSPRATWVNMTCLDRHSKSFNLRLFTRELDTGGKPLEKILEECKGNFIEVDINSTRYGLQTDSFQLFRVNDTLPEEVILAKKVIEKVLAGDTELDAFVQKYNLVEYLSGVIEVDIGYHLVNIASELRVIEALDSITDGYNIKLLKRAAIVSRACLLPSNQQFSNSLLNVTKVLNSGLKTDRELLVLLDVASREPSPNKSIYLKIREFVQTINNERRRINEETDSNPALLAAFSGLL